VLRGGGVRRASGVLAGSRRGGFRQALLRKPFDLDELLREVTRLLDLQ